MDNLFAPNNRPKLTRYIGAAIPVLVILFTVFSSFFSASVSLSGFLRNGVSTAIFVFLLLIMYSSVYTNHIAVLKDTNEEYKKAVDDYTAERSSAVLRSYSALDGWLAKTLTEEVEADRESTVLAYMNPDEYREKHRDMPVKKIRQLDIPRDMKKAIIRANRLKPPRFRRCDLLSYDPDGTVTKLSRHEDNEKRKILISAKTLIPKIVFAVFAVQAVFSVVGDGSPAVMQTIMQTISLLTTAYSALRNANTSVTVIDVSDLRGKAEYLKKFNATKDI